MITNMKSLRVVLTAAAIGVALLASTAGFAGGSAKTDAASAPAAGSKSAPPAAAKPAPAPAPAEPAPPLTGMQQALGLDPQSEQGAGKGADVEKLGTSPPSGSPYLGPAKALVIVNIFSDFQCPVCSRSADPIKQLAIDFPGTVKVIYRNNALEMHQRALPAALASLAAGKQGKFWQYYDSLFANTRALDDASLRTRAENLGLDMAKWDKDIAEPANIERVREESSWAWRLGAAGTPSMFVNGVRQVGWGSYRGLRGAVERELAKARELEASGMPLGDIPAARIREHADKNPKQPDDPAIDPDVWAKILTSD